MGDTTNQEPNQLVSDYEDLWNGEYSKMDVVAESVAIYTPDAPGGEIHGNDAFEEYLRDLHSAFPDFHITADAVLPNENLIMLEWTVTGTHEGDLQGLPPTGREFEVTGMTKLLLAEGKVQEDHIYYDYSDFLSQLGLTFPDILLLMPKVAVEKAKDLV